MKNLEEFLKIPIAHRGLHDQNKLVIENSALSFSNAVKKKVSIELDVHLSLDGEVIVFHDDNLDRLTQNSGRVSDYLWAELKTIKLLNSNCVIMSLSEVLDLVDATVTIVIEIKQQINGIEQICLAVNDVLKNYQGEIVIQSFNPFILRWFKRNSPELGRGLLNGLYDQNEVNIFEKVFLRSYVGIFFCSPDYIGVDQRMLKYFLTQFVAKIFSIPLVAWTITSLCDESKIKNECQNIIFENFIPSKS